MTNTHRQSVIPRVTLPAFNLVPNLVIDVAGSIAIVTEVDRSDHDSEIVRVTYGNSSEEEQTVALDYSDYVTILGTSVERGPGTIEMFQS